MMMMTITTSNKITLGKLEIRATYCGENASLHRTVSPGTSWNSTTTMHSASATTELYSTRRRILSWWVGVLDPLKYVGGVSVCFDPLKCHILSFKTVAV